MFVLSDHLIDRLVAQNVPPNLSLNPDTHRQAFSPPAVAG
jgi:hypothetical protein